jgi:hypothetical protein
MIPVARARRHRRRTRRRLRCLLSLQFLALAIGAIGWQPAPAIAQPSSTLLPASTLPRAGGAASAILSDQALSAISVAPQRANAEQGAPEFPATDGYVRLTVAEQQPPAVIASDSAIVVVGYRSTTGERAPPQRAF